MFQGPNNKPMPNYNEIGLLAVIGFVCIYPFILLFFLQAGALVGIFTHSGWTLFKADLATLCPAGINAFVFGLGTPEDVSNWLYTRYPTAIPVIEWATIGLSAICAMWFGWDNGKPLDEEIHISGPQYFYEAKKAAVMAAARDATLIKESGLGINIAKVPISRDRETKHMLVVGRVGGGKTVAITPMIQQAISRDSIRKDGTKGRDKLIIFDNKGDFTRWVMCADGTAPTILAPWDARSPAWNVAADCTTRAEASELAARFIPESGNDPMWSAGARQILTGFMVKLQSELEDKWTWRDLANLLAVPLDDVYGIMETYHPEGLRAVEKAEGASKTKGGSTSKTTQSLMITLAAQMSAVYRMAEAWENTEEKWSVTDFLAGYRIEDDGTRTPMPQVVILQGNATYSEMQKSYIQGVIAMLAARVNSPSYVEIKPSEPGLWLFLDELPQLGKLAELKPFLEIGRSKGVRVLLGMQDVMQMYEIYGKESAEAMLNICQSIIFAGLGGESSPSWAANMIGKRRVSRHRRSGTVKSADGTTDYTMSYNEEEDFCVKPNQLTNGLGRVSRGCMSIYWPGSGDAYRLLFPFTKTNDVRVSMVPAMWTYSSWKKREMELEQELLAIAQANVVQQASTNTENFADNNPSLNDEDGLEDDDIGGGDTDSGVERGREVEQEELFTGGGGNTPLPAPVSSSGRRSGLNVYGVARHPQEGQGDGGQEQAQTEQPDDSEAAAESLKEIAAEQLEELSPLGGELFSIVDMIGKVVDAAEAANKKTEPPQDNEYIATNE